MKWQKAKTVRKLNPFPKARPRLSFSGKLLYTATAWISRRVCPEVFGSCELLCFLDSCQQDNFHVVSFRCGLSCLSHPHLSSRHPESASNASCFANWGLDCGCTSEHWNYPLFHVSTPLWEGASFGCVGFPVSDSTPQPVWKSQPNRSRRNSEFCFFRGRSLSKLESAHKR